MTELPPCVFPLAVKEDAKEALLCIHPGGLPSRNYRLLAEAVPDASIYVAELSMNMRYVEAAQETVPAEGVIGELAGDVRAAFDAVSQGERILVLCGWSFGGVIAHEIALRMAGEDGSAPLLLVLDSIAPVRSYRFDRIASTLSAKGLAESAGRQVNIATWFVAYLNSLKGASIRLSRREAARMEPGILRATLLARSIAAGAFPPGTSEAGFGKVFQEFRRGMTRNTRLLAGYAPQGPKRDVLLVRAATPFFPVFRVFRKMGWDALARRVTTLTVRGDHYQLLAREEPMRRVALFLKAHLRRPPAAEASPGGSAPFQPTTRENSNV